MAKLTAFNFITLNGFFKGDGGDTMWHRRGPEESQYGLEAMQQDTTLLFGRVTYEMMAGFWPTPAAMQVNPLMAEKMNAAAKVVFSQTLTDATWHNTRIENKLVNTVRELKQANGRNLTVLGSGSIVTQLAEAGLIDTFEVMVDPVVIGSGTPLFSGINAPLNLHLIDSKIFKSGVVLLRYAAV